MGGDSTCASIADASACVATDATAPADDDIPWPEGSAQRKLHEWLMTLDDGQGALLQYFDVINNEFDASFSQIVAVRLSQPFAPGTLGTIDPPFWEICGIEPMG